MRWWPLFLISGIGLFLETAVIRWLAGEVRLFSYFKNLPLLAAFLGLSIGFALAGRSRNYMSAFAPLLTLFVVLVLAAGQTSSQALAYPSGGDDFLWYTAPFSYWLSLLLFLGTVLVFFLATVFLFIPLGQATGKEMKRHDPIPAYIVNIVASLVGVWIFSLLSYLQTPPVVWVGLGLLGVGLYLAGRRALSRSTVIIFALVLLGLAIFGRSTIWSPYQRLEVTDLFLVRDDGEPVKAGHTLNVQRVFYQRAIDLSPEFLTKLEDEFPELEDMAFSYDLPYRLGPEGGRVLIVGAGMGNDAAAALRGGAGRIDAVEIDPAILALGRELHPEHPYDDPRVTLIVDDARAFFEKSTELYKVIVFGLLDSHTLLSSLSTVRLDSFVYTIESFEQVREHLADGGVTAVTFATSAPWIEERLGRMLVAVFGPDKVFVHWGVVGTTFVAGSVSPDHLEDARLAVWQPNPAIEDLPLNTDDWPYLYLRARGVPSAYWQALLLIGVVCIALLARSFPQVLHPNWHFWLLGAGFLLVEFKSITELALLFGTTWFVNAVAISGVLLMALGANLLVLWLPRLNLRLVYTLLFVSLGLTYFFPLGLLIGFSPTVRVLVSLILLSFPLLFAGLIFGESLRRAGDAAGPLASNLSGSVAGGILEYGSLLWGIHSLYVIAAVVYLGALIASRRQRS
jgi:spermidine synthase